MSELLERAKEAEKIWRPSRPGEAAGGSREA